MLRPPQPRSPIEAFTNRANELYRDTFCDGVNSGPCATGSYADVIKEEL
jgi:hypothetical protein